LSLAIPLRLIVLLLVLYVEPVVGDVMLMLGGVVSGAVIVTAFGPKTPGTPPLCEFASSFQLLGIAPSTI
jgi:hypothetical protein